MQSTFFVSEDFYTNRPARYEAVAVAQLHSHWSLDEARRHELAQMQEAFAHEWLFYRDDPRAAAELEAYAGAELAAGEVNLRFERLAKLPSCSRTGPITRRLRARSAASSCQAQALEYRFDLEEVT